MTTTADTLETQETHLDESQGTPAEPVETPETAEVEQAGSESTAEGSTNEGEDSELTLQFGEEATPASEDEELSKAPQWVKELRKSNRELQRQLRAYEAKEKTTQAPVHEVPKLGVKPTMEQFDYDEGKYEAALEKWYSDKRAVDAAQAEREAQERARQEAAQARFNGYQKESKDLRVKDFQDAESEVVGELSVEQQGILLAGADKPALLVYALGRNPAKLKTLAAITDPVRFAFAAAKLEKELKVSSRTATKPAPETRVTASGGAPASGGSQKTLDRLREEAARTGDMTKVIAYKRQLKEAQKR
jgi:hypothetical protein